MWDKRDTQGTTDIVVGEGSESKKSDVIVLDGVKVGDTRTCVESIGTGSNQQQQQQQLTLTVEHLTRHFHEGFTGQQVNLSDVDILSNSTRSRAGISITLHLFSTSHLSPQIYSTLQHSFRLVSFNLTSSHLYPSLSLPLISSL